MALTGSNQFNRYLTIQLVERFADTTNTQFRIYQGTIPTAGVVGNWATYESTRSADLLAILTNAGLTTNETAVFFASNKPTPAPATTNGTATWAALKSQSFNNAIVGKVTEAGGDGLFILNDVDVNTSDNIVVVGFRMQW